MKKIENYLMTVGITFLLINVISGQKKENILINNVNSGEVRHSAFEILESSTITIKGKAGNFGGAFADNQAFYGWIIKSDNREIVWDVRESFAFEDRTGMYEFNDLEPLEKGYYEIYYSAGSNYNNIRINGLSELISKVFSGPKKSKFKEKYRMELGIDVTGERGKFVEVNPDQAIESYIKNSIVSINRVGNDKDIEKGFSLNADTKIRIVTLGEGRDGNLYDLAWISEAGTPGIVWKADIENSEHAGGGAKNYIIDEEVLIPKGNYLLHYSTDDSHSYQEWNVMPPNDPQLWGVTIWTVHPEDTKNIAEFDNSNLLKPMVDITRVGHNKYLSQGFYLPQRTEINVYGLGEGYDRDDLADYGWIINADTKEVIWTMNDNPSLENAGGAKKNWMVQQSFFLEKGNYIANYITDGSHSYEEWNSGIPFDKVKWGLTVWSKSENYKLFDADKYKSDKVIVEIVKVGDNEHLGIGFDIPKESKIRVYAIGEGGRSGMDDYGWIEDNEGDVVWEMDYDQTQNAGGASKNRLFNGTINLKAGKYKLYFETDGSHSYDSWNSSPPTNQDSYGITLLKL